MQQLTEKKTDLKFFIITALILIAAFSRLIPHVNNFSPLGATAIFGAAWFTKKWQAIVIPLAATFLSDLVLNNTVYAYLNKGFTVFYPGAYWQYISYLVIIIAALGIFKNKVTVPKVLFGSLTATALFFIISNFGTWVSTNLYPHTFGGLTTCYTLALPFIKGTLFGDLIFSALLFGSFALIRTKSPTVRFA